VKNGRKRRKKLVKSGENCEKPYRNCAKMTIFCRFLTGFELFFKEKSSGFKENEKVRK